MRDDAGSTGAKIDAARSLLDRAVFVSGRGRSGSTLLLRLFDGHPQVFLVPRESRVLTEIAPALRRTGDRAAAEAQMIERFADLHGQGVNPAAAARVTSGMASLDIASADLSRGLLRVGLEALAQMNDPAGARCFLEKTPKNEEHFDEIFGDFPQAKVIHLVRDPRAVYLSNKKSDAYRMEPDFAARQWVKSLRCVLRQVVKFGRAQQMLVLRYEDMVGRPRETLAGLCGFIGVDFHEALTRPTVQGDPWQGNAYGEDAASTHDIEAGKAQNWRGEITRAENDAILAEARFEMSLLGYPLDRGQG